MNNKRWIKKLALDGCDRMLLQDLVCLNLITNYKRLYIAFRKIAIHSRFLVDDLWELICLSGDVNAIEFAIKHGILTLPATSRYTHFSALDLVSMTGDLAAIKKILSLGSDIYKDDKHKASMLNYIAFSGNVESIRFAIQHCQAYLEQADVYESTPLSSAALSGNPLAIIELVNHGANPRRTGSSGWSILHGAAASGNMASIRTALRYGLSINKSTKCETILHSSMHSGNIKTIKTLIAMGVNHYAVDSYDNTILHIAATSDKVASVKMSISLGFSPQGLNTVHLTPLDEALSSGNVSVVTYLFNQTYFFSDEDKATQLPINMTNPRDLAVGCLYVLGINPMELDEDDVNSLHTTFRSKNCYELFSVIKHLIRKYNQLDFLQHHVDTSNESTMSPAHTHSSIVNKLTNFRLLFSDDLLLEEEINDLYSWLKNNEKKMIAEGRKAIANARAWYQADSFDTFFMRLTPPEITHESSMLYERLYHLIDNKLLSPPDQIDNKELLLRCRNICLSIIKRTHLISEYQHIVFKFKKYTILRYNIKSDMAINLSHPLYNIIRKKYPSQSNGSLMNTLSYHIQKNLLSVRSLYKDKQGAKRYRLSICLMKTREMIREMKIIKKALPINVNNDPTLNLINSRIDITLKLLNHLFGESIKSDLTWITMLLASLKNIYSNIPNYSINAKIIRGAKKIRSLLIDYKSLCRHAPLSSNEEVGMNQCLELTGLMIAEMSQSVKTTAPDVTHVVKNIIESMSSKK